MERALCNQNFNNFGTDHFIDITQETNCFTCHNWFQKRKLTSFTDKIEAINRRTNFWSHMWCRKGNITHWPYRTAPMNASPAPVVSTSSPGGITSAVPRSNLPLIEPTPSPLILKFGWKKQKHKEMDWENAIQNCERNEIIISYRLPLI